MVGILNRRKFIISAFVTGLIVSMSTVSIFADSHFVVSKPTHFSTYGHNYEAYSYLSVDDTEHTARATTGVQNQESKILPSGYLAACARLYSGGYLQTATSWEYNDEPAIGIQIETDDFTTRAIAKGRLADLMEVAIILIL